MKTPFLLWHYDGSVADEGERESDNKSGMKKRGIIAYSGTQSLVSAEGSQLGALELVHSIYEAYDGTTITVNGVPIVLGWNNDKHVFTLYGLIVYATSLSWSED